MSVNIILTQLGKPAKPMSVDSGTTIEDLLDDLSIDSSGKSFTVVGDNGPETQSLSYELKDGDKLRISANNAAA